LVALASALKLITEQCAYKLDCSRFGALIGALKNLLGFSSYLSVSDSRLIICAIIGVISGNLFLITSHTIE
jgi:hypothetical protein